MGKEHMTEHIKVNLPLTEQDYLAGNGEGVWVLVDPKTKRAHDEDAAGGSYVGILDNDSCYYPGLNAGELIPFEMRGTFRPVADFYSFLSKLSRLTPEGKALLMERIAQHQAGHDRITDPSDPRYEGPICCSCQYCGDKYSFPEPNDLLYMDPANPMLKHFYCCCGDCDLYGKDITGLEIVLRQLTGDQLTPEQRWQIAQAVGCRQQYRFRLCQGPDIPLDTADGRQMAAHLIFGDAKGESPGPAAVLVRCSTPGAGPIQSTSICRKRRRNNGMTPEKKKHLLSDILTVIMFIAALLAIIRL